MNTTRFDSEMKPFVSIIGESERVRSQLTAACEGAGRRVFRSMNFEEAQVHFAQGRPTGPMLIDVEQPSLVNAVRVVDAACFHARNEMVPVILSTPSSCLDDIAFAGMAPNVTWLCDPDPAERLAALAMELAVAEPGFADISSEMDPQRLRRLADEVSRIARTLANLTGGEGSSAQALFGDRTRAYSAEPDLNEPFDMPSPEEVRRVLRVRRLRDSFFDAALFADPAWDMLLDLLAARLERIDVAVSSLCIAAAVPPTTALRWIKTMSDHGLFERCADPDDGRRIFIRLSDPAMQAMGRYFSAVRKMGGAANII